MTHEFPFPHTLQEQLQTGSGDWQQTRGSPNPPLAAAEGPRAQEEGLPGPFPDED